MRLVALFPRSWRQRYGEEFEVLLEETNLSPSDLFDLVRAAWDAHVHPQPHLSGGEEMSVRLTRGLWSAAAAVAALIVLVLLANIPSPWTSAGLNLGVFGLAVTAAIFGAAAAGLWRWGRMRPLWVLLALLAVRNLVQLLVVLLLTWSDGVLRPLYWNLDPTGYGWLPGTLVQLAAGIALVVILARFLRLRLVTAVVIGLTLELLVGPSDLSLGRLCSSRSPCVPRTEARVSRWRPPTYPSPEHTGRPSPPWPWSWSWPASRFPPT